jgi:hypothetical protein
MVAETRDYFSGFMTCLENCVTGIDLGGELYGELMINGLRILKKID